MGLKVKRGTMQDAMFIEADHGSSNKPRGDGAKTRRSKDGTWAKKGDEIHFGYKFHQKTDIDYCLIREFATTTTSLHDSQVDLSVERPHVVIKRIFNSGWVLVTTVRRVSAKMMVIVFAFNLYQLCTLKKWNEI
jgi:IS5 family transposase